MSNRLDLDFTLETTPERRAFIESYITKKQFQVRPLTPDELETIANYLLWGKDPVTGLNAKQSDNIYIPTRHKTWDSTRHDESLEELTQSPAFNESAIHPLGETTQYLRPREVFNRKLELSRCPDYIVPIFEDLFARIDQLDLAIQTWEVSHNKRPIIYEPLAARMTDDQKTAAAETAKHWNQSTYLKQRHHLVELRAEQYTVRDNYIEVRGDLSPNKRPERCFKTPYDKGPSTLEGEVPVFPFGLVSDAARLTIWVPFDKIVPANYDDEALEQVSSYYWNKDRERKSLSGRQRFLDLEDYRAVSIIIRTVGRRAEFGDSIEPNIVALIDTIWYYADNAKLRPWEHDCLDMRLRGASSAQIAAELHRKYGRSNTASSVTSVAKLVYTKIAAAASHHKELLEHIYWEDDFRTCSDCGRTFLVSPLYFNKKGAAPLCKFCERERKKKKNANIE